jgi:hypothetical protein
MHVLLCPEARKGRNRKVVSNFTKTENKNWEFEKAMLA